MQINPADFDQWRRALADYPDVLRSLETIEDCEGDLEDAAITLAIQANLEPDYRDRWLVSYAKRFRPLICQGDFRERLTQGDVISLVRHLVGTDSGCPELLAMPVALQIMDEGITVFCTGF
ncbi:MAG: hypothetical protein ACO4AI_08560 [Prochlorothrix sp.]|nr:hypothetical protein [Prochlorothrix sp.]